MEDYKIVINKHQAIIYKRDKLFGYEIWDWLTLKSKRLEFKTEKQAIREATKKVNRIQTIQRISGLKVCIEDREVHNRSTFSDEEVKEMKEELTKLTKIN